MADYTKQVAEALRDAGDSVEVWSPQTRTPLAGTDPAWVHRNMRGFGLGDLCRLGREFRRRPGPRRLFVQWVPHGFGWRSMNVVFCLWLWWQACRGEEVDLMVHEPFLSFGEGGLKQDLAACVHRLMAVLLLMAADRVWLSTQSWEPKMRPFALRRNIPFRWLPVPSNIPVEADAAFVSRLKQDLSKDKYKVLGHFSSYSSDVAAMLRSIVPLLLSRGESWVIQLLGRGSERFREELVNAHPSLKDRVLASGHLSSRELSNRLAACDVLLQPYPDGVTTRRTTVMASLEHGVPTVTTVGKLSETSFWARSRALAMVPSEDPGQFVQTVEELLADQTELSRLSSAASSFYADHFALSRLVDRIRLVQN